MRTLLALALAASAVAAPVPKAKPADAELMEGLWDVVSLDRGEGEEKSEIRYRIKDGKLHVASSGFNVPASALTLDPSADPKRIDMDDEDGKNLPGIYKLDGDTLVVCLNKSLTQKPRVRPTEFRGTRGENYCYTYKRVKEEK